jgi:hypothetical protein
MIRQQFLPIPTTTSRTFDEAFKTHERSGRSPPGHDPFLPQLRQTILCYQKTIFHRLQTLNAFLRPHLQNTWTQMDTVPVGHVHKRNSKFADLDEILIDIETTLTSIIHRNLENQDLKNMQPSDDIWNLPEILVYPGLPQVEHNTAPSYTRTRH